MRSGRWARWTAALCFMVGLLAVRAASATVLNVPADHASIGAAILASHADDTVLVARGVYPELVRFPAHHLTLMSHYEISGDSADILETIIDGNSFADLDTATLIIMDSLCADGNVVSGFTLTGGHGVEFDLWGQLLRSMAVFMVRYNSPVIRHNIITGNQSDAHVFGGFWYSSALLRDNRVYGNSFATDMVDVQLEAWAEPFRIEDCEFLANPGSEAAVGPCVFVGEGVCEIRNTIFDGLEIAGVVVLVSFGRDLVLENCTITNCLSTDTFFGALITVNEDDITLRDNVFRDNLVLGTGSIFCDDGQNLFNLVVEGNTFENMTVRGGDHRWVGEGVFHTQGYRGQIENNVFRNCKGPSSGVGAFVINSNPLIFEHNLIEACSTTYGADTLAAVILRYNNENLVGHYNIFRQNFPRAVATNHPHPAQPMDFSMNYWGDPTGPFHPDSNAGGRGDRIGEDVLFRPWSPDTIFAGESERPPAWIPSAPAIAAYPNPFNNSARLAIEVSRPGRYEIALFSIDGRRLQDLWQGTVVTNREISVTLTDAPSGVYFARLQSADHPSVTSTAKLVLLR